MCAYTSHSHTPYNTLFLPIKRWDTWFLEYYHCLPQGQIFPYLRFTHLFSISIIIIVVMIILLKSLIIFFIPLQFWADIACVGLWKERYRILKKKSKLKGNCIFLEVFHERFYHRWISGDYNVHNRTGSANNAFFMKILMGSARLRWNLKWFLYITCQYSPKVFLWSCACIRCSKYRTHCIEQWIVWCMQISAKIIDYMKIIFPLWNAFASQKYSFAVKFYVFFTLMKCVLLFIFISVWNQYSF